MRPGPGARLSLAFVLGAAAGLALGPRAVWLQPLADLFIVGLMALGPPVALLALVSALASFRAGLGRLRLKAIGGFLATALAAATIGVGFADLLDIGRGFPLAAPPTTAAPSGELTARLGALIRGPWTYALIYAGFLVLLLHGQHRGQPLRSDWRGVLADCLETAYRLLGGLMHLAPVGVFALMAINFGRLSFNAAASLLEVLYSVYLGQGLVCAGCMLVLGLAGERLGVFLFHIKEALLTALVTGSSAATIPLEFAAAEQRLGIAREQLGLILPLGLALYKLGTAVYQAAVIVFAAHAVGHELTLLGLAGLSLLSLAASVITPPVSGGSWVALGLVFAGAGLPPEAIAVAAGIPLLGKMNTPLNSLGRLAGLSLLARDAAGAVTAHAPATRALRASEIT